MQAVILAAGQSSRFEPFREFPHKSLIPLLGKTILEHTIYSIKKAGITDIIIVVGDTSPIPELLGNGKAQGVQLRFIVHKNAQGMGAALLEAKELISDSFFLLNAYHLDFHEFANDMQQLQKKEHVVLLGRKDAGNAYGYMQIEKGKVVSVLEKPKEVNNAMRRIIGIYLLNKAFLLTLEETPLEHYHFEKALDNFAKSHEVFYVETEKHTVTLKYAFDLLAMKNYLLQTITKPMISKKAQIADSAEIIGNVQIEEGAKIMEKACIKGPCFIGKNAVVGGFALVRNGVAIEESAVVGARMEIKNSILLQGATTHSGFIGDSILGKQTKVAAFFCSANARLDRQPVPVVIKGEKVTTGLRHFGVMVGNYANVGIRVSTMPGVIIGNHSIVGPSSTVMKNISDNTKYYTKFKEVIEEQNDKK